MGIENILPIANFPNKSGMYKFAEMLIYNEPFLRFAKYENSDSRYYLKSWTPAIITEVSRLVNKSCPLMFFDHGTYGKFMIPTIESDWYKLVGAGYAEIDAENKEIKRFLGKSCVYPGIDYDFIEKIKPLILDWTFPDYKSEINDNR